MILLDSIIGIIATACFIKLLFSAIQPGQIFGGWQTVLKGLDQKGYSIVKPLGYCELCWCNMWAFFSFWIFFFVTDYKMGCYWVILFLCYHCIAAVFSLYVLVKLFK